MPFRSNETIISTVVRLLAFSLLVACLVAPASAPAASALPDPCTLLTNAQVAPAVGGKVELRSATRDRFSRTCTWTGPPMGYMQMSQSLILQFGRVSRSAFVYEQSHSSPQPTAIRNGGIPTFLSNAGLSVWKDGIQIELDGPYLTVYPGKAVALANHALGRL